MKGRKRKFSNLLEKETGKNFLIGKKPNENHLENLFKAIIVQASINIECNYTIVSSSIFCIPNLGKLLGGNFSCC